MRETPYYLKVMEVLAVAPVGMLTAIFCLAVLQELVSCMLALSCFRAFSLQDALTFLDEGGLLCLGGAFGVICLCATLKLAPRSLSSRTWLARVLLVGLASGLAVAITLLALGLRDQEWSESFIGDGILLLLFWLLPMAVALRRLPQVWRAAFAPKSIPEATHVVQ